MDKHLSYIWYKMLKRDAFKTYRASKRHRLERRIMNLFLCQIIL